MGVVVEQAALAIDPKAHPFPERALHRLRAGQRCRVRPAQGGAPLARSAGRCEAAGALLGESQLAEGYITEKLLLQADPSAHREPVSGEAVRYVDWLFPGILGMNVMFSGIFGVGYVVLRYRKNGFLKRLHATPLSAWSS